MVRIYKQGWIEKHSRELLVCLFTFFASKCWQLLVTFVKSLVLQNGLNSSKSSQMKQKTWKSMNLILNVWQNFTFPWGKPTAAHKLIRKPACCRSEPPSTDILKPQNLSKICLFFILFSRTIINVIIPKKLVASRDVNIGEVRLGDYSPVFTSQWSSATKMLTATSVCLLKVKTVLHNVLMDSV